MATRSAAAFWYSLCPTNAKEKVLIDVGKTLAKRYELYKDALMEAAGIQNAAPAERLAAYRGRAPQVWRLLEKVWPAEKSKQSKDWQALESTSLNKELAFHLTRDSIAPALRPN